MPLLFDARRNVDARRNIDAGRNVDARRNVGAASAANPQCDKGATEAFALSPLKRLPHGKHEPARALSDSMAIPIERDDHVRLRG